MIYLTVSVVIVLEIAEKVLKTKLIFLPLDIQFNVEQQLYHTLQQLSQTISLR